nr:PREDICTED: histone-lysine N-methyltransferase SMYD3 isoform X1 [Lepisosteus oculatus]
MSAPCAASAARESLFLHELQSPVRSSLQSVRLARSWRGDSSGSAAQERATGSGRSPRSGPGSCCTRPSPSPARFPREEEGPPARAAFPGNAYKYHSAPEKKEKLLRCSQCKIARYCDASCQKAAWSEHKRECKCLRSFHPRIPTDSVRLAGRIVFKLLNYSSCPSEELFSLLEHESHIKEMSEEKKEGLGHLATMLQLYLKEEVGDLSQLPPGLDIIHLFAIMTCNCFTISDGELQEIGVGLYPSMSLLNHDCDPNCVIVFQGRRLFLRAIREIRPAEELTVSYIDVLVPAQERRTQLQNQYCFVCECQQCDTRNKDEDMLAGNEKAWKSIKDATPGMEKLQSQHQWEQVLSLCQTLVDNNQGILPDTNIYLLKMLDYTMDACINLRKWDKALFFGTRTLQPYRMYYQGFHPALGVQLMRLGKLQYYMERFCEALDTLKQAYEVMKVTHGVDHPLTTDLQQMLGECQAEMDRTT